MKEAWQQQEKNLKEDNCFKNIGTNLNFSMEYVSEANYQVLTPQVYNFLDVN